MAAPLTLSAMERLQRFVEREDESYLEKPILLEKESGYRNFQCCLGALQCLGSWGISALLCPIGTCAPYTMFPQFSLRLDKDSVQLSSAVNDCCCHVAATQKTVPLEKVQDVELQETCLHTCFGLKSVNVQTAGASGTPAPEIAAAFLASPALAREAIQTAVKLHRQRAIGAPLPQAGRPARGSASRRRRPGGAPGGAGPARVARRAGPRRGGCAARASAGCRVRSDVPPG